MILEQEHAIIKAILHLFKAKRDMTDDPDEKELFDKSITLLDELREEPSKERINEIMKEHAEALEDFRRKKGDIS